MSITNPYLWHSTCQNLSSKVIFALALGSRSSAKVNKSPLALMNCLRLTKRQFVNDTNTTSTTQKEPSISDKASKEELASEDSVSETAKIMAEKEKVIQEKEVAVKDLKDKYMRALAENENLRNRSKKLVADSKLYGIQSFSKDLLEVADILEKATEIIPEAEIKNNEHLKHLFEGVTMTQTQLLKVFGNHGLEKVDPAGEKFDPNFHEALFMLPSPDKEPGTVAVVTKVGYRLHGRPLRAALVGVVQATS